MNWPSAPVVELGFYVELPPEVALAELLQARTAQGARIGGTCEVAVTVRGDRYRQAEEVDAFEVAWPDRGYRTDLAGRASKEIVRTVQLFGSDGDPQLAVVVPHGPDAQSNEWNPVALRASSGRRIVAVLARDFVDLIGRIRPLYASMGVEATIGTPSELRQDADPDLFSTGFVRALTAQDIAGVEEVVTALRGTSRVVEDGVLFDLPGAFGRPGDRGPMDRDLVLGKMIESRFSHRGGTMRTSL